MYYSYESLLEFSLKRNSTKLELYMLTINCGGEVYAATRLKILKKFLNHGTFDCANGGNAVHSVPTMKSLQSQGLKANASVRGSF